MTHSTTTALRPDRGVTLLWLAALSLVSILALGVSSAARAAACQTSGPVNGSYTITLCVSAPTDGSTVTGSAPVTVSATVNGAGPGVQRMVFYLDGTDLLTDYQAPYSFTLSSARFVDGARTLEVEALMRDRFVSERASVTLQFQNGVTTPPPTPTGFVPRTGTTPPAGQPFVVAAVGDGAGGEQHATDVVNLIDSWNPNMLLYLGDVYERGTPTEYDNWYAPASSYGRFNAITNPTIGNHEYENGQAPGYFDYWRSPPNYFSFDVAGWHVVSLNSTSQFNQVDPGTGQYTWLANDLTTSTAPCTLVYFHHPFVNVGQEGPSPRLANLWSLLASHGVDVVLTGHDHSYQRYVRLDAQGSPSASGIVQFVAGAGGHGVQQFVTTDSRLAFGADTSPAAFGALRLELNTHGTAFRYVNKAGTVLDSGSFACSGAPADTTAPSVPTGMTASVAGPHTVNLGWSASGDNVGVSGYRIIRNGSVLATVGQVTSYTDLTAASELTYSYQVRALDAAGNVSAPSATATVTTPAGESGIFVDAFESGGLGQWTSVTGLTTQQQDVFSGSWAARGQSTGAATWAYKTLPSTYTDLYYRIRFKVLSQSGNVYVLKFRTSTGVSLLGVYLSSTGKLSYRNDIAGQSVTSNTTVASGTWHTLQVRVLVNGASGETETWLDDAKIPELSKPESFGPVQIGRVQLGENSTGRTYNIAFDTVLVDDSFIDTSAPTVPTAVTATPTGSTGVDLSWTASTDNLGVAGYTVYRDGQFLVGLPASSLGYTDGGLGPSSTHTYTVDAFDGAGNHSAQSAPATTTTPPDTTAPSAPAGLEVTGVSGDEVDLSWSASTDDVGVAGYGIYRDGALVGTVEVGVLDFVDTTVVQATTYTYTVDAFDAAGNNSQQSNSVQATTPGPPDTTPPTQPSGLTASVVSATRIDLAWAAATDNVGVAGYTIYRNGGELTTVSGSTLAFNDTTVAPGTAYTYTVDAYDAAGNRSPQSEPASANTGGDTSPPTTPGGVTATALGPGTVDIAWSASSDDVAVTGYAVYRDGVELTSLAGSVLTYRDTSVSPSTAYSYTVDAVDAAGNRSPQSSPADVTTPQPFLFADDFESGGLGQWTSVTGVVVQQQEVFAGAWAARATSTGPATWAFKTLATGQTSLYYRIRFKILSQAGTVYLLKLRTATGTSLLGVYVGGNGKLGYRNDVAGQSTSSPVPVSHGVWHTLQVHVVVNGASGQAETWLDGTRITQLSKTESLGTTPIGRLQLGENSPDRTYDIAFDTVAADGSFIEE